LSAVLPLRRSGRFGDNLGCHGRTGFFRVRQRNAFWADERRHARRRDEPNQAATHEALGRLRAERTRAEVVGGWQGVAKLLEETEIFG